MELSGDIYNELRILGLTDRNSIDFQEIRNKDGIYLYRVTYKNDFFVLKYFMNEEYTREIKNYDLLREIGVPTIKSFGCTENSILLEDLEKNSRYRLGKESDLSDAEVAKVLAKWYVKLHNAGSEYRLREKSEFYREIDSVSKANIKFIINKSSTEYNNVWNLIVDNWDLFLEKIKGPEETLTYNDFFWTNLAVSFDKREAIMFDYNLLGIGLRYSDIRNVCSSLSEKAQKAFVDEYGKFDEVEKIIDDGITDLISLISAYKRPSFPKWAEGSLKAVHNGQLEKRIMRILELPNNYK